MISRQWVKNLELDSILLSPLLPSCHNPIALVWNGKWPWFFNVKHSTSSPIGSICGRLQMDCHDRYPGLFHGRVTMLRPIVPIRRFFLRPTQFIRNLFRGLCAPFPFRTTTRNQAIICISLTLLFLGVLNVEWISAQGLPNLTPYQPAGWSDRIIVANTTGATTDSSPLKTTDSLYVSWAVANTGAAATNVRLWVALFVDGTLKYSWYLDPPFNPNTYVYIRDFSIGSLGAGTHILQLVADSTGSITESNENDNVYNKSVLVLTPALPNLTPYQPSGWSGRISMV